MSSTRAFTRVARLATITASLMFALIVVGSVVRTTGSGLSCPDWPLCQGKLIPPMQFNIFMEWVHRLIALLVGVLLFATAATIALRAETRARLGGLALLAVVLYFTQALLGALTVWKLLDPSVVSGHLAVGLLLFATLVTTAMLARLQDAPPARDESVPASLVPLLGVATLAVWLQAVLGGMVSTNHASLACPDWPRCNGEWFPPMVGLVGLQVAHRIGAYALTILLLFTAFRAARCGDAVLRWVGHLVPRLIVLQVAIGVANVLMGIPVWVSALHLGNAAAILALLLIATLRTAATSVTRPDLVEAGAR